MSADPEPDTLFRGVPVSRRARWLRAWQPFAELLSGASARKGYLAAMDQGVISIANFLAAIYLARLVSPTEFGVYAVGFIALHLVRAVQEGLVVQPLNSLGAALPLGDFRSYASSTGVIQLLVAAGTSAATALAGWILTWWGNDTAGPAMMALWFPFLFWQLQEFIRRTFYTRGAVRAAVINTLLANVIRLGVLWWFGRQGLLSGRAGMYAIGWGALGALAPGLWQARTYWAWRRPNLRATWIQNWRFGRWVLGGVLANWMALELYPILTAGMISFAAAGAYRALQNPVAPVHVLLRAMDTFLTPRAARIYHHAGPHGLRRILRLTYLLTGIPIIVLLVGVTLYPEPVLRLFYGTTYLAFSPGMGLMALFYGLWYLYWPVQSVLKAIQRTPPIFIANLAATLTMFTLGLWAIRRWGVYGTIAGQAINALIVCVVLWVAWLRIRSMGE